MDLGSFAFANTTKEECNRKQTKFCWRLDPEKSFSDWTVELEILDKKENTDGTNLSRAEAEDHASCDDEKEGDNTLQTVFHVHRNYLGSGERRSLYFERLFGDSSNEDTIQLQEGREARSEIKLEVLAVRAFPNMLDYIYCSRADGALDISSDSAVALRWLSLYFGIKPMFEATNKFIGDDLSIENAHEYLKDAAVFGDGKIVQAASKLCSEKLGYMLVDNTVQLSPEHFSLVVEKAKGVQASELLSQRVMAYCDVHRDTITAEMLAEWTDHRVMPVIAADAALSLLRHSDAHNLDSVVESSGNDIDGGTAVISSIRERCAKAASKSWETTLIVSVRSQEEAIKSGYCDISDKTKVTVLEKALINAHTKVQRQQRQSKSPRSVSESAFGGSFGSRFGAPTEFGGGFGGQAPTEEPFGRAFHGQGRVTEQFEAAFGGGFSAQGEEPFGANSSFVSQQGEL